MAGRRPVETLTGKFPSRFAMPIGPVSSMMILMIRNALAKAIRDLHFRPLLAASGHDALAILVERAAGAVSLDLCMSGTSSPEILRSVRAQPDRHR